MTEEYVDISKVSLRPIAKNVAKDMIKKHQYTHNMNGARYALGVYYKQNSEDSLFDTNDEEQLIGCVIYAHPVSNRAIPSICGDGVFELDEVLELIRLFVHDGYGKNIESYVIGQSFEWLK
jgi:hypothetical protein